MKDELRSEFTARGRENYLQSRRKNLRFRIKRKPSVWAEEERYIAAGQSPLADGVKIRYRNEVMPHAVEPMDSADDPDINIIVLWMGRRLAKTEGICGNVLGRTVTDDPGLVYSMWPVQDSADRFGRDMVEPMIQNTPCLDTAFVAQRSRDAGRTMAYKRYEGGSIYIVTAGSPSQQRGMAAKVVLIHEVDAYPNAVGSEGDPVEKALGRAEGFGDAIKFIESTGTLEPEFDEAGRKIYRSRIHFWYERGDQRKYFCACQECGHLQWLRFPQIQAENGDKKRAAYVCQECENRHYEAGWRRMVKGGIWFPTAGLTHEQLRDIETNHVHAKAADPVVRSYWINGFNSLLPHGKGYSSKLHQFLAEEERAKVNPESYRVWVNEVATELYSKKSEGEEAPPYRPIFDRRENYGLIVPKGGLYLTAFGDVQKNRIELGWRAWGKREESWGMDHVVIEGYVRHPEVWKELRRELKRKWDHESGAVLTIGMAFIDGGAYSEEVYAFLRDLARNPEPGVSGHVRASKGIGRLGHPIVSRGTMATVAKNLKGHHLGTWQAKDAIYERLRMEPEQDDTREGLMHYNMEYGEEYFIGLTRETPTRVIEGGHEFNKYRDIVSGNEPLDIEVGCLGAFRLFPRNLDTIEQTLLDSVKPESERQRPQAQQQAPRQVGSFGTSWGGGNFATAGLGTWRPFRR